MKLNRSLFQNKIRSQYRIENKTNEATVYLYDEVSLWGIDAQSFVKDINSLDAKTIHLRMNSPGGMVFDGMSIYNALKEHAAHVIAHIDGLAASISSVILMAANEIRAAENAFIMIHNPWSMMAGDADDLRAEADLLDKVQGAIVKVYQDRSGKEEKQIRAWMEAETWFTAGEALDAGFVDAVDKNNDRKETNLFDLSIFNNVPDELKGTKPLTERDLEHILRDAGCSRAQAKSILADGYKGELRDAVDPDPENQRDAEEPEPEAPAEQRDAVNTGKDRAAALIAKGVITRSEGIHIKKEGVTNENNISV